MRSAGDTSKKSKKEKKKRKCDESPNAEAGISPSEFTLNQHSCRKKKKKEKNSREELEESQNHCHSPPKKKNKLSDGSGQDKKTEDISTLLITNKNTEIESGTYNLDTGNKHSSKRKKKKAKRKDEALIFPENESSKDGGNRVIESSTAEVLDINVDSKAKKTKRIKKHKKAKEYEDFQTSSEEKSHEGQNEDRNTSHNDTPSKKKKKKKKSKNIDEKEKDGELNKKSMLEDMMETFTASNDEDERKSKKKKKISKKEKDSEIINEEKEGSDDNSSMKQPRNTEVSRSDKAGADKSGIISTSPKVGQWGTAGFENDKQQEKFLRLLGGFKTGSKNMLEKFTKASGSNPDQGAVNCAMNKGEEEKYKRNMENQYEKAMSMNLNRGVGFGFDTTSIGKKFHIDKFQSKSMKFDD